MRPQERSWNSIYRTNSNEKQWDPSTKQHHHHHRTEGNQTHGTHEQGHSRWKGGHGGVYSSVTTHGCVRSQNTFIRRKQEMFENWVRGPTHTHQAAKRLSDENKSLQHTERIRHVAEHVTQLLKRQCGMICRQNQQQHRHEPPNTSMNTNTNTNTSGRYLRQRGLSWYPH